ncbi:hypothetical protein DFP72DRAFT_1080799 [Ephemerocybe angulata]|uniref:Uncharacterized protein n=1 Tax=Ephemerocybe angulata TaxID=980116 RepID=A0A8H6HBL7_9AGAR|nr:hypothetical protein DFP72DRAFT_1080799 [Tulosesus angulatus]
MNRQLSPETVSQLPGLAFLYTNNRAAYTKAYCIAPPSDACPFSVACPNTDVTGIGQQVSIYIATVVYGNCLVLAYVPGLRRPMLYAHLTITYSLLIAALVSILQGELSKADGLFVIVTVASPPSIYLWCSTFASIWCLNSFPFYGEGGLGIKRRQRFELHAVRVLSFGTLAFEVVMVCLLFIPNISRITFPQASCDRKAGTGGLWYNIVWELPLLGQLVGGVALSAGVYWSTRAGYYIQSLEAQHTSIEGDHIQPEVEHEDFDLISWTWRVLSDLYPNFMTRNHFLSTITIAQLSVLPTPSRLTIDYKDSLNVAIYLACALSDWWPQSGPTSPQSSRKMVGLRALILLGLIGVSLTRAAYRVPVPSTTLYFQVFLILSLVYWCHIHVSMPLIKRRLFTSLISFLIMTLAPYQILGPFNDVKLYQAGLFGIEKKSPDGSTWSLFTCDIFAIVGWVVAWILSAVWVQRGAVMRQFIILGIGRRAHLLKASFIIAMHTLWIQASNNSNPSRPTDMPFGQIFAVIATAAAVIPLVDEALGVGRRRWKAVLLSDPIPPGNTIP